METTSYPTIEQVKKAAQALKEGHLVAFPTETVYGLGADATNENAVNKIYSVKNRPKDHPLIVHISSINNIHKWAIDIPDYAMQFAEEFWPGPMTLILKRSNLAKNFITGGQNTVGLRVPNDPIAQLLLKYFENLDGQGIVAPSANKFQEVSPTCAQHVEEDLKAVLSENDLIIDGGKSKIGIESTIINCLNSNPEILRPGFITLNQLNKISSIFHNNTKPKKILKFSGMHQKHYSPKAHIYINSLPKDSQGLIALSDIQTPKNIIRLCSPENNLEFAQQLYDSFRKADKLNLTHISVFLPKLEDIGESVVDRIVRAANIDLGNFFF
jgi:L-threonylcarbamoyladenylate synthase